MGYRPGPWVPFTDYNFGEDSEVRLVHHSTADFFEFEFKDGRESYWTDPQRWEAMVKAVEEANK